MTPYMQQWLMQNGGLLGMQQQPAMPQAGMQPQGQPPMQGLMGGLTRPPSPAAQPGINLSPGQFGQWGDLQRRAMTLGNTGRTGNG